MARHSASSNAESLCSSVPVDRTEDKILQRGLIPYPAPLSYLGNNLAYSPTFSRYAPGP